jgi:hypothetical protein
MASQLLGRLHKLFTASAEDPTRAIRNVDVCRLAGVQIGKVLEEEGLSHTPPLLPTSELCHILETTSLKKVDVIWTIAREALSAVVMTDGRPLGSEHAYSLLLSIVRGRHHLSDDIRLEFVVLIEGNVDGESAWGAERCFQVGECVNV